MTASQKMLIIDDHAMLRAGCRQLVSLHPEIEWLEAGSGEEGLKLARAHRPRTVILDLNLPGLSGFDVLKALRDEFGDMRILVFSMYEDPLFAARAMEAGANSFVSKVERPEAFMEAIEAVMRGEDYLSHRMAQKLAMMQLRAGDSPLSSLTRRELDILRLFANGKSLGEIAGSLNLNYRTVANVISLIKRKLNVGTNNKLVVMATEYWKGRA